MKTLIRAGALALACLLLPASVAAEIQAGKEIVAPLGKLPAQAIYCDDGTGKAVLCAFSGGTAFGTLVTVTLSAAQAAGTAPILAQNPARRALVIVSGADGWLTTAASGARVWKLFAGLDRQWSGGETPTGALYAVDLAAGSTITILEG
jgi:hypothetical protein